MIPWLGMMLYLFGLIIPVNIMKRYGLGPLLVYDVVLVGGSGILVFGQQYLC